MGVIWKAQAPGHTPGERPANFISRFNSVRIDTVLPHGDLLESGAGQRHQGHLLMLARKIWPRRMIRKFAPRAGLFMLVNATK